MQPVMDKQADHNMDDLLVKYLLGEATPEEALEAQQWIQASGDHQRYFEGLKQIWQSSYHLNEAGSPDEEEAWQRFRQRVQPGEKKAPAARRIFFWQDKRRSWMPAAAILLLVVLGSWAFYRLNLFGGRAAVLYSGEKILTDTLPDGTVITLNKNSRLSYPRIFNGKSRTVQLNGEAFFEVAAHSDQPFTVQAGNVTVTVLGTAFNVKSSHEATEVIVETGRVEVTRRQHSVQLGAHEKVTVSAKDRLLDKEESTDELYSYYRTRAFVCNKTPLRELVAALNEAYDAHIAIADPALGNLPITTTFSNQPLDTILSIISQTFGQVTYIRQGQQIILK